jgi:hypothetical protein
MDVSGYSPRDRDTAEERMSQDNHPRGGDTTEQWSGSGYSSRDGDTAEDRMTQDTQPRGGDTTKQRGDSGGYSSRDGDTPEERMSQDPQPRDGDTAEEQRWALTLANWSNAWQRSNTRPEVGRSERSYFFEKPKAKIMPSTLIVVDPYV